MSTEIPRDAAGRVIRPRPSQLLMDVMDKLGPDHLTTRTLMAALIERDRGAGVEPRAVTPGYGWHLPVLADAPNVPYDMQETALDVEATLGDSPRDSGWRNIGGLCINGWTAPAGVFIKRAGPHVMLSTSTLTAPATWNATVLNLPDGFRSLYTAASVVSRSNLDPSTATATAFTTLAVNATTTKPTASVVRFSLNWLTEDDWPATLPGTPAVLREVALDELDDAEAKPS